MSRNRRSVAGIFALGAMALAAPAAADAAAVSYPAGGSAFSGSAEGWNGSGESCGPAEGAGVACSTTAEYTAAEGNPPGSITSRIDVLVNAGGLLKGQTLWTSPDFVVTGISQAQTAALSLDRRLDGQGVGVLDPESTYTVRLIDRTESSLSVSVLKETIDDSDSAFARQAAAVPAGTLVKGHTYALSITTVTTTRTARLGVLGSLNTRYDNVSLALNGSALQPIGGGASGTSGVTVTGTSLTDRAMSTFLRSFNPYAEVGRGPGGTLVPAARCTIVGTAGRDRIKGTPGNDVICGLGGNDRINGAGGNDVIDTGNGADIATGGGGRDTLVGVRGRDRLKGGVAADRLGGGASPDRLAGGKGNDGLRAARVETASTEAQAGTA